VSSGLDPPEERRSREPTSIEVHSARSEVKRLANRTATPTWRVVVAFWRKRDTLLYGTASSPADRPLQPVATRPSHSLDRIGRSDSNRTRTSRRNRARTWFPEAWEEHRVGGQSCDPTGQAVGVLQPHGYTTASYSRMAARASTTRPETISQASDVDSGMTDPKCVECANRAVSCIGVLGSTP